jgi:UDP-4-amino-4,6-dideoxy-N-acetyl-beta-L-altrosamine N-acetyltransferase
MMIRKYGLTLHRLSQKHLELVRVQRNNESIRRHMFYQDHITPEMQQKWFNTINNYKNYYFVIEYKGELVGLINGKNVDYEKKTTEGGLFIWDEKYWTSLVPVVASIIMADLTFSLVGIEQTFAEVQSKNIRAVNYNLQLGYQLYSEDKNAGKQVYVLTRENYLKHSERFRKAIAHLMNDETPLSYDDIDWTIENKEQKRLLYDPLPAFIRNEIEKRLLL